MSERQRHVLGGDLEGLEFAVADYISVWGQHFGTTPHEIAGLPCAVANMAMTVIRKNLLATWEEAPPPNDQGMVPDTHALACDQCDEVARTPADVVAHDCGRLGSWYLVDTRK